MDRQCQRAWSKEETMYASKTVNNGRNSSLRQSAAGEDGWIEAEEVSGIDTLSKLPSSGGVTPGRAPAGQMTWLEDPPPWLRPAYCFASVNVNRK